MRDIAVGNVVGTIIFDIRACSDSRASWRPTVCPLASMRGFDIAVMIAVAVGCFPIFAPLRDPALGGVVVRCPLRRNTTWLVFDALGHEAREAYASAMVRYVMPLSGPTLAAFAFRALWQSRD